MHGKTWKRGSNALTWAKRTRNKKQPRSLMYHRGKAKAWKSNILPRFRNRSPTPRQNLAGSKAQPVGSHCRGS